jgi:YesN/AraC family two-component response regulator
MEPGVRVVDEAADGEEGLHLAQTLLPDLWQFI